MFPLSEEDKNQKSIKKANVTSIIISGININQILISELFVTPNITLFVGRHISCQEQHQMLPILLLNNFLKSFQLKLETHLKIPKCPVAQALLKQILKIRKCFGI